MADLTISQEITIELDGKSPFEYVVVKQGDKLSRNLSVSLLQNKQPYTIPAECTARIKYFKPDGKPVLNDCTISSNKILVTYTAQMLAAAGTAKGEIVILQGTRELKSATYYTKIVSTVYQTEGLISDKEFLSVAETLVDMNKAADAAAENANIADAAASTASTATINANNATKVAGTATTNANNATRAAGTATEAASQAAKNANTATEKANTAANAADIARVNASEAVGLCNSASSNANAKAVLANNAAQVATTVANTVQSKLNAGDFVGPQGVQGKTGEPFQIAKVYTSVEEMNAGYVSDTVEVGQFVIINTGNVADEDNAKLYLKSNTAYEFITDLSGAEGMEGPQGPQGIQGVKGDTGDKGDKGDKGSVENMEAQPLNYVEPPDVPEEETEVIPESGDALGVIAGWLMKKVKSIIMTISNLSNSYDELNRNLEDAKSKYPLYNTFIPNALLISDLRRGYVFAEKGTTGMPAGVSTGTREVYKLFDSNLVIEIREHTPQVGRIWRRQYNGSTWSTPWTQV